MNGQARKTRTQLGDFTGMALPARTSVTIPRPEQLDAVPHLLGGDLVGSGRRALHDVGAPDPGSEGSVVLGAGRVVADDPGLA